MFYDSSSKIQNLHNSVCFCLLNCRGDCLDFVTSHRSGSKVSMYTRGLLYIMTMLLCVLYVVGMIETVNNLKIRQCTKELELIELFELNSPSGIKTMLLCVLYVVSMIETVNYLKIPQCTKN